MAQMKALGSALPPALVDCFPGWPSPPWLPGNKCRRGLALIHPVTLASVARAACKETTWGFILALIIHFGRE